MPRGLLLLLLLLLPAPARAQEPEATAEEPGPAGEEAFDAAYAHLQDLMEARRWTDAYDGFQALFDAHAGAGYAMERLSAIELDLKRCAFWRSHDEPRLEDLFDAEVMTWNPTTGALRLRADPQHLGDFHAHVSEAGTLYELPAKLSAGWTVVLRGSAGMLAKAQVHALIEPPWMSYVVRVGHLAKGATSYIQHQAVKVDGETTVELASADPLPADPAQPCVVEVAVAARSISLQVDQRPMLDADRDDAGGFGRLAFSAPGGFESIELEGRAEKGWIDGRLDAAVQAARDAFDRAWDPSEHMPAWLSDVARADAALPDLGTFPLPPFDLSAADHPRTGEHMQAVQKLFAGGRPDEALAYLDGLGPGEIEPTVRAFLECLTLYICDRPRAAFAAGGSLWTEQRESLTARYLEALLQFGQKRDAEALAGLQKLTEEHPEAWEPWYALTSLLMILNRRDEARAALDLGLEQAADPAQLRRLAGRLVLLFKGPGWRREHVQSAGHFVVHTDSDANTCLRVARECAAAWRTYERLLGAAKPPAGATIPVFLFSGQASYTAYAKNALGADMQHTAGLFDRTLQAILVWNAPAHETLQATLRHEVLHQYLDARLGGIPTWFNEGLAEYYENAEEERGLPLLGAPHRDHVDTLAGMAAPPDLERLVQSAPGEFYRGSSESYASAWALVHLLRETTPARRRLFDGLWKRLERREDNETALEGAFADVDWAVLGAELAEHVRGLADAPR